MRQLSILLVILSILSSCKNEAEVFHSLQFDVEGLDISYNRENGSFGGILPPNESIFTITGKGDYAANVYVSSMHINGKLQEVEGMPGDWRPPHPDSPNYIIKGEWGEIKYLTDTPPYSIEFRISPNRGNTMREIDIQLGFGYWVSHIILNQSAYSEEEIRWDNIVCNQISKNEIYIGSQFLGVQNRDCIGNPPQIYPSAIFPEESFATTFDKEVASAKNPITLYTDFSNPYIATIDHPSGVNYQHYLKNMLKSEEYVGNMKPHLHLLRIADLGTTDNITDIFPENPSLANTLLTTVNQKMGDNKFRTWLIGEIVFRGFTVTMDVPDGFGLLVDHTMETKGLVYVRSLTYGATAYFVVGSNLPYDDVKAAMFYPNIVDNSSKILSKSSIILIANSSLDQEANLYTSFESLNTFMVNPYTNGDYGYPIYCTGCYLDDNSFFHFNTDN